MIIDGIIAVLTDFLEVETSELAEDTALFFEYDLEEEDIQEIIERLNDKFDIEIDTDEFCELESLGEIAEYVEALCAN